MQRGLPDMLTVIDKTASAYLYMREPEFENVSFAALKLAYIAVKSNSCQRLFLQSLPRT